MADVRPHRTDRTERLRELRAARAAAFRGEIVPHFRYVLQSGFGLVLSAIGSTLIIGYFRLLRDMPADWPADLVGWLVIALLGCFTPLRTYFQPADIVFAAPLENALLQGELRPLVRRGVIASALRMALVFAVFAPLYRLAPATAEAAHSRHPAALGAALALLGAWSVYAAWSERRVASGGWRLALRAARYAVVLAAVAGLLLRPFGPALLFALLGAAVVTLLARLPLRHALPWERLIAEEAAARRRWFRFLGWFVDLPNEASRPARRPWIAWAPELLPWRRGAAWRYLYAKMLLRSDTFGAFWRWNVLLLLILAYADKPVLDALAFAVAVFVGGLQLTELGRMRIGEPTVAVPLEEAGRRDAAAFVVRAAGLAAVVLLWLVAALPSQPFRPALWFAALALALLWAGWLLPRRMKRGLDDEDDD